MNQRTPNRRRTLVPTIIALASVLIAAAALFVSIYSINQSDQALDQSDQALILTRQQIQLSVEPQVFLRTKDGSRSGELFIYNNGAASALNVVIRLTDVTNPDKQFPVSIPVGSVAPDASIPLVGPLKSYYENTEALTSAALQEDIGGIVVTFASHANVYNKIVYIDCQSMDDRQYHFKDDLATFVVTEIAGETQ